MIMNNDKVKIYTYYEDLEQPQFNYQSELIDIWKTSWLSQGFNPIILNLTHAKSHSFFKEFTSELNNIHKILLGKDITRYELSCWHRWLAYATQQEENFYVSDYDVYNTGFQPAQPQETIRLMCGVCPCFASGSPKHFERLCYESIELSYKNLNNIKERYPNNTTYHDQNFFQACREDLNDITITRLDEWGSGAPPCGEDLHHISHFYTKTEMGKRNIRNMKLNEYRVYLATELIKHVF